MSKPELISALYNKYKGIFADKEIVFGEGNTDAVIMLVGEAPGKDEVRLSKPFVGAAGKNLNEFLDVLGVDRNSIYITNAIKYRLSKVNEKSGRVINRPAREDEIKGNREYLYEEIRIIKPEIVVTLGNVPLRAIKCRNSVTIGNVHGTLLPVDIGNLESKLFPLYHPASIIYNRSLKDTYVSDVLRLKQLLQQF